MVTTLVNLARKGSSSTLPAILLALTFLVMPVGAADFTIAGFHSDISINEDSSFSVKETVEVEFQRPSHGIYRELPFRYIDETGYNHITPIEVISVTDTSGKKWKTKIENRNNVVHIRVGDAEKYVSGKQTYIILYKVENALLFFEDHDELYWNVTGNFWKAPIREASVSVTLSTKDTSKILRASCYTGVPGSRASECRYETDRNSGEFLTKKGLAPGEGLTVAFGWDKGLTRAPSGMKMSLRKVKERWSFLLPFCSLLIMLHLWRTRGRDPKVRESVNVMYGPPEFEKKPLNPAEVGALVDEKLDPRDITSSIVGLAVKGYLKIEETRKEGLIFDTTDYCLTKAKEPDADLSAFESGLMRSVFSGPLQKKMVSEMKNTFYRNLESLKQTLYSGLVEKKYFLKSPERVRYLYAGAAVAVSATAVTASVLLTHLLVTSASFSPSVMAGSAVAGLLTGLPVLAFSRIMPAKTRSGASAYMDILGFREFMIRAEKDRLERMGDKNLFSRFLPYAIALGVADNWAKAFEGIYQDPPDWYASPGGFRTFSPYGFSHSIGSMTSTLGTAVFSSPRGSGISGSGLGSGGSSGGGFGGGGGGSW